jgi:hypothetical protein
MAPLLVALSGLLVVAVAATIFWAWLRRGGGPARAGVAQVLAAVGPARCQCATGLLRRLAARGDARSIASSLDAIELPLLQAIPDCPPPLKPELVDALDACAACTANRAVAKRLVDLRNALLSRGAD